MTYPEMKFDLEEIIEKIQAKTMSNRELADMESLNTNTGQIFAKSLLAAGMIILGGAILGSTLILSSKIDQAQVIIDRGVKAMEQVPAATERMEKLLDRTDETVQRSFDKLNEAIPRASEGWIDGVRRGLNKETK